MKVRGDERSRLVVRFLIPSSGTRLRDAGKVVPSPGETPAGETTVVAVAELLALLLSARLPLTVAVFETVPAACWRAFTTTSAEPPGGMGPSWHVTVFAVWHVPCDGVTERTSWPANDS